MNEFWENVGKTWSDLWKNISENLFFVLGFLGVIILMFVIAVVFDRVARKKAGDTSKFFTVKNTVIVGVLSAVATVLFLLDFPVPFAPVFYKMDFGDLPALLGAFSLGPVAGVVIEFVKVLLKLVIKGTSTAYVGDFANFVTSCSLVLPAAIIYHFRKTRKTALIACIVGTVVITVFGTALNAFYLLPAFAKLYGMPLESIIAMGTKINPAIKDVSTFVIFAVAPLNLIKGLTDSLVTFLIYKPLKRAMKL